MNINATSATSDFVNVDAYYESLILNTVAQADAPLHEALVRSNVYRSINDSYERALAQLVIDSELLYANGEYSIASDSAVQAVEPAELEAVEHAAAGPEDDEADIVEPDADGCDTAEPEAVEVAAGEPVTVELASLGVTAGVATEAEAEETEAVESGTPEDPAPMACGPISLRADSTLEQLKVNERSWPIPIAVGVSYDKKPADGLSLMGFELPAESVANAEQPAEQQEPVQVE